MTSCCGVYSLLGLCDLDYSISVLNFNKLIFMFNDIFDNFQLFSTDSRTINYFFTDYIVSFKRSKNSPLCAFILYYYSFISGKEKTKSKDQEGMCINSRLGLWKGSRANSAYSSVHIHKTTYSPTWTLFAFHKNTKSKRKDLTQSYDKSPYTSKNVKRAKRQHKQRHKKVQ